MKVTYEVMGDKDIPPILLERRFTAKDVMPNVSYRMLNYWHDQGFLLETGPSGEWRRFNFFEVTWVHMLDELRRLHVELKDTVLPLKLAFVDPNIQEIILENREQLSKEQQNKLMGGIKVPPAFIWLVWWAFEDKSLLTVRIYEGGKCKVVTPDSEPEDEDRDGLLILDFSKSFISISISDIMARVIGDWDFDTLVTYDLLDPNELKLLRLLKGNDLKEVTVKYKDGRPHIMEISTEEGPDSAYARRLLQLMQSPYEEITGVTNGGETCSFIRTKKVKL